MGCEVGWEHLILPNSKHPTKTHENGSRHSNCWPGLPPTHPIVPITFGISPTGQDDKTHVNITGHNGGTILGRSMNLPCQGAPRSMSAWYNTSNSDLPYVYRHQIWVPKGNLRLFLHARGSTRTSKMLHFALVMRPWAWSVSMLIS